MSLRDPGVWIAFRVPRRNPRLRLFCLPYAGGGATAYRSWAERLPETIEVCPIQLPGRETRIREDPPRHVHDLLDSLVEALGPWIDLPFAVFGHSLGAILAYALARELKDPAGDRLVHLLVSGRRSPSSPSRFAPLHPLPSGEFRRHLARLGGTPPELLRDDELMSLVEPRLRADFEMDDTYAPPSAAPKLSCPVTAFGGAGDWTVSQAELDAWHEVTNGTFRSRVLPGDHFTVLGAESGLTKRVGEELALHLSPP